MLNYCKHYFQLFLGLFDPIDMRVERGLLIKRLKKTTPPAMIPVKRREPMVYRKKKYHGLAQFLLSGNLRRLGMMTSIRKQTGSR